MKNNSSSIDTRTVLTLDAGGTNFVFSAIRNGEYVVNEISMPSCAANLDKCLGNIVEGFSAVIAKLDDAPVAISFAFPGPADYPNGIIGGYLPNFPSFRDGVALGAFLEDKFNIPVFINNDADLYAYGEAIAGKLPEINEKLKAAGSEKVFRNLLGYTFGTGFGFGFVSDGLLHIGDNSCVETFCLRHKDFPGVIVEEGVAVRAVKRVYGELAGNPNHTFEPKDIFDIAEGKKEGNKEAAIAAFHKLGEIAGDAMATAVTMIDGIIVIGGGITAAHKYIIPGLLAELRGTMKTLSGDTLNRVQMEVFNLDDEEEFRQFAQGKVKKIKVYGTDREVTYDYGKRIGVAISTIGANKAIALGAYKYAINKIDSAK